MNLKLGAEDIAALEKRTEGWIAGLQLAALSISGHVDGHSFIRDFTGDNRFIVDYLMEEVLSHQSNKIRDFLLKTSVCERFCAPLCNWITGESDSQTILETLERENLFIIPLDDKRQWYRYHHLFADLLRSRLAGRSSGLTSEIHRKAGNWFKQNNHPGEAIRHILAAGDVNDAADLAERVWPEWEEGIRSITWLGWTQGIPQELVRTRPMLGVAFAWAYLNQGELETAAVRLAEVEHQLESNSAKDGTQIPFDEYQALKISLTTARAYHAQAVGNLQQTEKYTRMLI